MYMVLATLMVVVVLANVVLTIIASQSRLTHHQVSRIQAYYASMAGINYATEMLRLGPAVGGWDANSCPANTPCSVPLDLSQDFHPAAIKNVSVVIVGDGLIDGTFDCQNSPGNTACIYSTVDYAYQNP